jgi:hypothetical protein
MMRRTTTPCAAGLLVAMLLAGCGAAAGGSTATTGDSSNVTGVVVAGPRCPVQTAEKPCPDTPVGDVAVSFTPSDGGDAVTVRSATDGTFTVVLAPGEYVALVQADPAKGVMSAKPEDVTVPATGAVQVTLHGDTGIR